MRSAGSRRSAGARREARGEGRHLGLGIGCYIEGTGVGPFEERLRPHRPDGQDLRLVRRLPAGPGHGDDFCPGRRRSVEGRTGGRRLIVCRHGGDRDRVRHDGKPQHGHRLGGDPPRERAPAGKGLCDRRQSAGMRAGRSRIARRRRRRRRRARRDDQPARIAQAARPGWENPRPPGVDAGLEETFTGSRRPSPGAMRCTPRSSRSTARPAA